MAYVRIDMCNSNAHNMFVNVCTEVSYAYTCKHNYGANAERTRDMMQELNHDCHAHRSALKGIPTPTHSPTHPQTHTHTHLEAGGRQNGVTHTHTRT